MDHIESRSIYDLNRMAAWPVNDGAFNLSVHPQPKVQTMIVLSAETTGGGDFLQLG